LTLLSNESKMSNHSERLKSLLSEIDCVITSCLSKRLTMQELNLIFSKYDPLGKSDYQIVYEKLASSEIEVIQEQFTWTPEKRARLKATVSDLIERSSESRKVSMSELNREILSQFTGRTPADMDFIEKSLKEAGIEIVNDYSLARADDLALSKLKLTIGYQATGQA